MNSSTVQFPDQDNILFALPCSGDCEISDEMYQEVLHFAELVAQRNAEKEKRS